MDRREQDEAGDVRTGTRRRVWLGGGIALVVLAVLAVVGLTGQGPTSRQAGTPGAAATADPTTVARLAVARRQAGDPLALGPPDAPVVVAEWGDFQCPFCRAFHEDTEPAVRRQYVDTGRVRFEWHDFAYLGPESVLGARAARAAGRQGKFWPFHDALYDQQPRENSGAVTTASLTRTAMSLGLDVPRFVADYQDPAIAAAVADDQAEGARLGVVGVPSFVIGPQLIFGAQPLTTFQQAIDPLLDRSR